MTIAEAKATIYANVVYACEKAGFAPQTTRLVQDACDTIIALADRKTENCSENPNNCDTCKHNKLEWFSEVCDGCCGAHSNYEPKTEQQTEVVNDNQELVKDLVKAFGEDGTWLERQGVYTLTLAEAKQRAVDIIESVLAKTEPQTEEWHDDCNTCRWHEGACTIPCCDYEPKDEHSGEVTEMERLERIDNDLEDAWAKIRELTDEPQTDCAWMKGGK